MALDDIYRHVELLCPTCGATEFEFEPCDGESYPDNHEFRCMHCGFITTYRTLIDSNREAIDATVEDMEEEIVREAAKELKRALKRMRF